MNTSKTIKVKDVAEAIEEFAPRSLQENYDNAGLQIGDPCMGVSAVLLCLDVTEKILDEAIARSCNMIITHHPLLFGGLKQITGRTPVERIAMKALANNIAIYSAHTNLDAAWNGVSHEMARSLGMSDLDVLSPSPSDSMTGLGVIGAIEPTPTIEFLRKVKATFEVKALRYSADSPQLVIRNVALCGGSGASFIREAIRKGADCYITGDLKYHDFTSYGYDILLTDIGHFEGERVSGKIFSRILREKYPDILTYFSEAESNPVKII